MRYAQLINGVLEVAPRKVSYQGNSIYNPPNEVYEALGYYPVNYTRVPDDAPDGYHYESGWSQEQSAIVQIWELVEDPDDISSDEALAIIMGEM